MRLKCDGTLKLKKAFAIVTKILFVDFRQREEFVLNFYITIATKYSTAMNKYTAWNCSCPYLRIAQNYHNKQLNYASRLYNRSLNNRYMNIELKIPFRTEF